MAKFQVGSGIDEYIKQLQNLEFASRETLGAAIYKGADIVADQVRHNIEALPKSVCSDVQKAGLLDGFGIAKMQDDGGYFNVKLGFAGYNAHRTQKYPNGHANSMIARSIESGTSFSAKYPFVAPAVRATKDQAERAMADEVNNQIEKLIGG